MATDKENLEIYIVRAALYDVTKCAIPSKLWDCTLYLSLVQEAGCSDMSRHNEK